MANHLNRYAYCQGNPINQNDPFGLCPQEQGGMTERDWIHLGLSILGCIPVVGIAANIANAVLYFQEGDALNGLLSVAGALIGVGGVTAAIGAAKGICALTTVGQAIKTAGVAYTAGASAMQTIEAASKTFNMLKENDFQWNEEILISAGQTALSLAGTIAGFKAVGSCINEAAALSASGLACFVAGTKVLTDKGFKNIEDIEEGDYVYSTSDETGESGYKEVLQVFQKETEVVTHVFYEVEQEDGETRTEEIETTLNHLFWCEGEWKAAGTLKPGDKLTLADGSQVEVTEITYEDRHTTVYNMEVEDYHTYHVGEDGVWVHNTDGCGVTSGAGKGTGTGEATDTITDSSRLLEKTKKPEDHHIIPAFRGKSKPYADFIKSLGIDVDQYTVTVSGGKGGMHMNTIHGRGGWNQKWIEFIDNNPNATSKDIFQFAGKMMDDYGLSGLRIHPYGK